MRNSKQYYEKNYNGLETSEAVIDALEYLSAEIGIDFQTLWEDGCTDEIAPDQMIERVISHIMRDVSDDDRSTKYYWGNTTIYITDEDKEE